MKIFRITLIIIIFLSGVACGDIPEKRENLKLERDKCSEPALEVYIKKELFEASWYSSILLKLLSGNPEKAKSQLGAELSFKIILLNEQLEKNPCKVPKKTLEPILPFFRLIAAINNNHPIPKIENNVEVIRILKKAIEKDPKHYAEMINMYR